MDNITSDSIGLLMQLNEKILMIGVNGPKYDNEKKFIDDISKLYSKKKFVVVNVFAFEPTTFKSNLEFCQAIKEKLNSLQIPHYFITPDNILSSWALVAGNINVKVQQTVCFVRVSVEDTLVREMEYTENGFKTLSRKYIEYNQNESHQAIREKILGSTDFEKILLLLVPEIDNAKKNLFKTTLQSKKLVCLDARMGNDKFFVEIAKWYFDKSYTKFFVLPTAYRSFYLCIELNQAFFGFISVEINDPLPFTKNVTLPMLFKNNLIWCINEANRDPIIQCISFNQEGHKLQITFAVDDESFPKITVHISINNSIKCLPDTLDKNMTKKIPVIGFYGTSFIICVYGKNGYKFLDSWNGLFGKELIIGFDNKKPTFFEDALELLQTKPTFAVYDLIGVMSKPADNVKTDELWAFTVTKDSAHPVLLEFDSYDGTKKAASPAFLMAMLLRQHLKSIQTEMGEKPAEIGFYFFYDLDEDERARVEAGLKEACELLKIDCTFV